MKISTIIMIFTSLLFLAMGISIFYSKTFKNLNEKKKSYVKINAMIYIFIGVASLVIGIFDYINETKMTMLIFTFIILISALSQLILSKKAQK